MVAKIEVANKSKKTFAFMWARSSLVMMLTALLSPIAVAQDDADNGSSALEEVVVTGSRIQRQDGLNSPVPVTVLNSEYIANSGLINIADILKKSPSIGLSSYSSNNPFNFEQNGVNALNLRNLGEQRALVLVDGRRRVSNVPGENIVDFNSIPADFIERVELVTGGATAVYGSGAISGVINVIQKRNYEGVNLSAQTGTSSEGDKQIHRGSLTVGSDLSDGGGNVMINVTWDKDEGLYSRDRAISRTDSFYSVSSGTLFEGPSAYSSGGGGGSFYYNVPNEFGVNRANEVYSPFNSQQDGYDRNADRLMITPSERIMLNTRLRHDLTETVEFYFDASYAEVDSLGVVEPLFLHHSSVYGSQNDQRDDQGRLLYQGVPLTNPLIPDEIRQAGLDRGETVLGFSRRLVESFARDFDNSRTTTQFTLGLKGEFNDRFSWDTYYSYGASDQFLTSGGFPNIVNMRFALDAIEDPNSPGSIICRDHFARADACVPFDMFGYGNVSQAALDYVSATKSKVAKSNLHVASALISGDLFDLPAGTVAMVSGVEFREESSTETNDPLTVRGQLLQTAIPNVSGSFDVSEVFFEIDAPLLSGVPGVEYLALNVAGRYSHYSTVGGVPSWKVGLVWSPIESVAVRTALATSSRAPNINELFRGLSSNFEYVRGVADVCANVTAASTGTIADNCLADPGIAATVAATGTFEVDQSAQQSISGFESGNPNLNEETADTFTFGMTWQPETLLPGLALSLDYYDIEIEDAIDKIGAQAMVDRCYGTAGGDVTCNQITRFASGQLNTLTGNLLNLASLRTSGIESNASYARELTDTVWLNLNLNYNYLKTLKIEETAGSGFEENADSLGGTLGAGVQHRWNGSVALNVSQYDVVWNVNYLGEVFDNKSVAGTDRDYPINQVDAQIIHDLRFAYNFGETQQSKIYIGINNVADTTPPLLPAGTASGRSGLTTAPIYDSVGRYFYVGMNYEF